MSEIGAGTGSSYPGTLDTNSTVEVNSPAGGKTKARAEVPNDLAAAIVAIETELGTDPAGTATDVKTNLQSQHNTDGTHKAAIIYDGTAYRSASATPTANTVPVRDANKELIDADGVILVARYIKEKTGDENSTTSFTDVSGITFSVSANTDYFFNFEVPLVLPGTSHIIYFSVNGPASPNLISYRVNILTYTGVDGYQSSGNDYDQDKGFTGGTNTSGYANIAGILRNGANAGTIALRMKHVTAAFTVKQGAIGELVRIR